MADRSRLYKAYGKAGKARSEYKSSLYDIEAVGYQQEASRADYEFESAKLDRNVALASEALGAVSDIAGGYMAKKEAKKDRGDVQESMAKKAYKPGEDGQSWDELDPEVRKAKIAKYDPVEVERDWVGKLFGEEKKYTFGEGGDEYTSAQITAASSLLKTDALSELTGASKSIDTTSKVTDKVADVNKTPKDAKMQDVSKVIESSDTEQSTVGFGDAFKQARNEGEEEFEWGNQKFHTRTKEEELAKTKQQELADMQEGVKSFAKGGEYTTDGPEMILVGDNPGGKEKVKVTPIKSKGKQNLADNIGTNLKDLVSKKGSRPGSKKWMNEYIGSQKINNESLRPLQGQLSKHNNKLFSMAEESGYFGEFFKGGWD